MGETTKSVILDSRKFLGAINNSAQSRVAVFEDQVKTLGKRQGSAWKLAALLPNTLFIEDASGNYFIAEHKRQRGGRTTIQNIRPVQIVQGEKKGLFEQNCSALVDALEENNHPKIRAAWGTLAHQRFSPYTVPASGIVKTKDGVARRLRLNEDRILDDETKQRLAHAIAESLTDQVVIKEGKVVSASFGAEAAIRLPVSDWTCRRVVAEGMRNSAKNACKSLGFQARILKVAKLVDEAKVKDAVTFLAPFLKETQEFCLLSRPELRQLITDSLAARGVFNEQLCEDVTTLFHRTNLRINKETIVQEWRRIATKAQHDALLENVNALSKSQDFEGTYDKFLNAALIEAASPRDEEISAYRTALDLLRDAPQIAEDAALRTKIEELLTRLNDKEVDDATVAVVRETLATARKEVDGLGKLSDFDQIPGDTPAETPETGAADTAAGTPIIINSPLIQIGGVSGGGAGAEGEEAMPAEPTSADSDAGMAGLDDMGGEGLEGEGGGEGLDDMGGEGLEGGDELDLGGGEDELDFGDEDEEEGKVNINLDSIQRSVRSTLAEGGLMDKIGAGLNKLSGGRLAKHGGKTIPPKGSPQRGEPKQRAGTRKPGSGLFAGAGPAELDTDLAPTKVDKGNEGFLDLDKEHSDAMGEGVGDALRRANRGMSRTGQKIGDKVNKLTGGKFQRAMQDHAGYKTPAERSFLPSDELEGDDESESPESRVSKGGFGGGVKEEWEKPWLKKNKGKDDDQPDASDPEDEIDECGDTCNESSDPYAFNEEELLGNIGSTYGESAVTEEAGEVVQAMWTLAESHRLLPEQAVRQAEKLASAALKKAGIMVPQSRMAATLEHLAGAFVEKMQLDEAQYKWGTKRHERGLGKSSIDDVEQKGRGKKAGSGGFSQDEAPEASSGIEGKAPCCEWVEVDEANQGAKGVCEGVTFVLSLADPPALLSEDGGAEVPIPGNLVESAMASVNGGDGSAFENWLSRGIEQFRPITEQEEQELDEAVATIRASADGSVEVEVTGDVEVTDAETAGADAAEIEQIGAQTPEGEAMPGDEMQPVTDPALDMGGEGVPAGDEIPDFDAEESPDGSPEHEAAETPEQEKAEHAPGGEEEGEVEEEEAPVVEDKDITDPESKTYDTTKQDHREQAKEGGKAQKPKEGGNLDGFDKKPAKAMKDTSQDVKLTPAKPGKNRQK